MTPAQEAKEYAAQHGFSIGAVVGAKRYFVYRMRNGVSYGDPIAEVSGYPAALNAMKRYMQEQTESAALELPRACSDISKPFKIAERIYPPSDFPFEDDASKGRIRAEARRIRGEARRITKPAEGSPEWFARRPWRIVCGSTVCPMAYATRFDALKTVRQRFSGLTAIRIVYMGA